MLDKPRRRQGAGSYGVLRLRRTIRPPVRVVPAPDTLVKVSDVGVVMRDGVTLRVNVYRPPGPGPFPVILSAHPYGKDILPRRARRGFRTSFQFRIMNQPSPFTISSETSWEAPDPVRWTEAGYAVVNADLRGAGTSDGVGSLFTDAEARDVYDLIEWAGVQSWSTGRVGMLGVSYLAISQYKAAALHPPHLRAICPWEGFTDIYRDFMKAGGIDENGFSRIWVAASKRAARLSQDIGALRRAHPLRDAWWESLVPDLAAINVPLLVCASFSDADLHSTGSMRAFQQAGSVEKHAYTHRGPKWATFYSDDAFNTQRSFFDRHLRERDEPALPRVRLEVRESKDRVWQVRDEDDWPLPRTAWRTLHLGPGGELCTFTPEAGSVRVPPRGAAAWDHQFGEDTEVSGPMTATLWVRLERGSDATIFCGVEKWSGRRWIPFEGSYGYGRDRVASGRQRLSLRRLDPTQSTPGQPVHAFHALDPVPTGETVPVVIALTGSSTLFRKGQKLRFILSGRSLERSNPLTGHFPAHYRADRRSSFSLHWSPEQRSHLLVPVIPSSLTRADPPEGA